MQDSQIRPLVLRLFDAKAIKFEEVVLKSGQRSPVYIDLRVLVTHPDLMVGSNPDAIIETCLTRF